jgi:hypothetical protein
MSNMGLVAAASCTMGTGENSCLPAWLGVMLLLSNAHVTSPGCKGVGCQQSCTQVHLCTRPGCQPLCSGSGTSSVELLSWLLGSTQRMVHPSDCRQQTQDAEVWLPVLHI